MATALLSSSQLPSLQSCASLRRASALRPSAVRPLICKVSSPRFVARASAEENGASASPAAAAAPLETPANFGLGGSGAWFGFGVRQELNVGRLAMVGFASALVMEVVTGKGVLGQLGLNPITVRYPFLFGFLFLLVGGLLGGYVVVNNPPDFSKAPPNLGDGAPRNPFDKAELDRLPTYTRGGVVDLDNGQKGREPYASDLKADK